MDEHPAGIELLRAPDGVIEQISKLRRPILIAHVTPDADALGSMFALYEALKSDSVAAKVSLPEGSLSLRLAFMVESARPEVATPADFQAADGFIVLDTARASRCLVEQQVLDADWVAGRPMIVIDHHDSNTAFGSANWVEPGAGSTCEIVWHFCRIAGKQITPLMASMLLAGIHTDTAGFSLPTTSASALRIAGDLVSLGADIGDLGERLCRSQKRAEFDLLRVIYANTRVEAGGRIAYSTATYDEIHGAGCTASDIDDQVSVPRSLEGAELSMLFTEGVKGKTRVNLRGSGAITVVELAGEFGGGGHSQSAGVIFNGPVEGAVELLLPAAQEHLKKFD